jgi:hypothetical protein
MLIDDLLKALPLLVMRMFRIGGGNGNFGSEDEEEQRYLRKRNVENLYFE